MTPLPILPDGLELVRTTPEFDQHTTPAGLLGAHRTAPDVWGRLVVHTGETSFAFDDQPATIHQLSAGDSIAIAPQRPHRVILPGPVRFVVEFHRATTDTSGPPSAEVVDLDGTALPGTAAERNDQSSTALPSSSPSRPCDYCERSSRSQRSGIITIGADCGWRGKTSDDSEAASLAR